MAAEHNLRVRVSNNLLTKLEELLGEMRCGREEFLAIPNPTLADATRAALSKGLSILLMPPEERGAEPGKEDPLLPDKEDPLLQEEASFSRT